MERRFVLFVVLSFAILFGHIALMSHLNPPKPGPDKPPEVAGAGQEGPAPGDQQPPEAPDDEEPVEQPDDEEPQPEEPVPVVEPTEIPHRWITLGSADQNDPYRMLITLTSRGAAIERIELNGPRYLELDDRAGYIGNLVSDETLIDKSLTGKGCPVQVVAPGTPAAKAGLKPGDLIVEVAGTKITGVGRFRKAMQATRPKRPLKLTIVREGEPQRLTLNAVPTRRPLQLIRPEGDDPLSLLLTLQRFDDEVLEPEEGEPIVDVGGELNGIDLWKGNWEVSARSETAVEFRRVVPRRDGEGSALEIVKRYSLQKVPLEKLGDDDHKAYHLFFEVKVRNVGRKAHQVAYQLDGPTGLPSEGAWYANKAGRTWSAAGLRDVAVSFDRQTPSLITCANIAKGKVDNPWQDQSITFIGVDAQYFSAVMIPTKANPADIWFAKSQPLRVGPVDAKLLKVTNTSCRVISNSHELQPGQQIAHRFTVFAGPKVPDLLANYQLDELVYYGWFTILAKPMVSILHVFNSVVFNYGLAIIMLTVLVRGCMFPLSRKQALGAQKMQELQPEIKKLQEKYKNDMEGRTKAQQDLFRKHNYNPLSGCLVLFFQLPIFIALYRALMVDIELRQAPLISQSVRWCSNLAAPDMLYRWEWMPEFIRGGIGIFGLGPYFNLLPILTIGLFIMQQKMFMPPPTDEQSAMQQKMMKYMMVFMGLIFFKVASGLCIYFIASSLWGLAERKLLPKTTPAASGPSTESRADAKSRAKAQAAAEAKAKARQKAAGRDGSRRDGARRDGARRDWAPGGKKKKSRGK